MNAIVSIKSKTAKYISDEADLPVVLKDTSQSTTLETAIRWGSRFPISANKQINSSDAIQKASDKALCRQLLREAGVPVPEETEDDFPIVGRTRHHSRGRGFYYCEDEDDVAEAKRQGAVYFARFYDKTDEYRVHVGGGRTLLVSIKVGNKSKRIWNRRSGFKFRHMRRSEWLEDESLHKMVKIAKKAVKTLGLDFGAVDVMVGDEPEIVVSEVNTSPALSPLAVRKYARYFNDIVCTD